MHVAGPQADKFAGGHRIRVPPVPIPNTEVKPDTADGTVWETVWESRSLPALSPKARDVVFRAFFFFRSDGLDAAVSHADHRLAYRGRREGLSGEVGPSNTFSLRTKYCFTMFSLCTKYHV